MTKDNRFYELNKKDITDLDILKQKLTIDNPKVAYLIKTVGIPKNKITEPLKIKLYTENESKIFIPRAALDDDQIISHIPTLGWDNHMDFIRIKSNLTKHPIWKKDRKLRDYQLEPVQSILNNNGDILTMDCGGGKTVCGVNIIGNSELPALVVIQTDFLAKQWVEEATEFLDTKDIVIHKNSKIKESMKAKVVVASVQALMNLPYSENAKFYDHFKLALFDEVHSMGSMEFVQVISNFPCRRIGLTATPDRTDGFKTFKWAIGSRMIYGKNPNEIKPLIVKFNTNHGHFLKPHEYSKSYRGNYSPNMPQLINCLVALESRTKLAIDIANKCVTKNRNVLLLVHRRNTAEVIFKSISTNSKALRLGGASKEPQSKEKFKVIVATFQYAKQAFNAPWLDTLILMTPFGAENDTKQASGRILRVVDEKKAPIIIDFLDIDPSLDGDPNRKGICQALFNKRLSQYKKFDYEIHPDIISSIDKLSDLL